MTHRYRKTRDFNTFKRIVGKPPPPREYKPLPVADTTERYQQADVVLLRDNRHLGWQGTMATIVDYLGDGRYTIQIAHRRYIVCNEGIIGAVHND